MTNIILIGLPGAGKSTLGVILAKSLGMNFIDTDIIIQENVGQLLQEIIDSKGSEGFLRIEEQIIRSLQKTHTVIATGGSVVYSEKAMEHLKSGGIILYLNITYDEMVRRLSNISTRGIVLVPGQNLREMYDQRISLYEKYADISIDSSAGSFETVVEKTVEMIKTSLDYQSYGS